MASGTTLYTMIVIFSFNFHWCNHHCICCFAELLALVSICAVSSESTRFLCFLLILRLHLDICTVLLLWHCVQLCMTLSFQSIAFCAWLSGNKVVQPTKNCFVNLKGLFLGDLEQASVTLENWSDQKTELSDRDNVIEWLSKTYVCLYRDLVPVTQLYVSVDASTREGLKKIDRPLFRDFWDRFIASLRALSDKVDNSVDFASVSE